MKPNMKIFNDMKKTLILTIICMFPILAPAQGIEEVMESISSNNLELKALRMNNDASKLDIRAQNNLQQDLSFSYSPFFQKGVDGVASSEMVVSFGFDFPSVYFARHKSGEFMSKALDMQYALQRQSVLINAKNLCLDLIRLNKEKALIEKRLANAESLIVLVQKKFDEGLTGILELNRVKMERMNVKTLAVQNEAAIKSVELSLTMLNGNIPVSITSTEYPEEESIIDFQAYLDEVMANDKSVLSAQAAADAAELEVKVNRQNWVPKFEVGYRRNTALKEASDGFLVGASIPLFSSAHKTKAAKSRHEAALAEMDNARIAAEADYMAKFNEMQQAYISMGTYDVPLMTGTVDALDKAVIAGKISIIDYFVEADNVYQCMLSYLEVENMYHKLMTEVFKNRL